MTWMPRLYYRPWSNRQIVSKLVLRPPGQNPWIIQQVIEPWYKLPEAGIMRELATSCDWSVYAIVDRFVVPQAKKKRIGSHSLA